MQVKIDLRKADKQQELLLLSKLVFQIAALLKPHGYRVRVRAKKS